MEVVAEIRYDRQQQIGALQGRNSSVFRVTDQQLGGELVAKEVDKARFNGDPSRYFDEARAMFAATHQNVVPIRYACQNATHVILAMPLYRNGSLASRIATNPISVKEVIRLSQGVLHGIGQIHAAGFVHLDIKPSNILFDNADVPLVADFGQSMKALPTGGVLDPEMYTWAIPPEVFASGAGSFLSDIYQAGLLFYRAVNGNRHYEEQFRTLDYAEIKEKTLRGKLPDRNSFLPHVPKRMRTIIRKALRVDPVERYQSAREFAADLARMPAGLNWLVTIKPSGEATWRADRDGRAALEVELTKSANRWETRAWTINGLSRRAKEPGAIERSYASLPDVGKHLNEVFEKLA